MYQTLELSVDGGVATVALNRPDARNAFNAAMIGELTALFSALGTRNDVRAIVLRGNGKTFSAGADVEWMRSSLDLASDDNVADALRMSDMFSTIDRCSKPVVARVQGAALGGGMGLLAVSDIVVAEEHTVFGFTEARLGIIPAVIARFVVPKIGVGWSRALFLTAERFGVETAQAIGIVHWITDQTELDGVVNGKVEEILACGPAALAEAKRLVGTVSGMEDAAVRDLTAVTIARLRTSAEGQEGLQAFLEKRRPNWVQGT